MKLIQQYSDLIILTIIWIVSIYSLVFVRFASNTIAIQNYIGYGLLIGLTVFKFLKIKKFKTILGVFLIIGSMNAAQFTHSTYNLVFSLNPLGHGFSSFGIQPLSMILLIFFVFTNFVEVSQIWTDLFSDDPQIEVERQRKRDARHYEALKNEDNSYLQEIINNKSKFQMESVKAAKRLIEERKTS